MYIYIYIYTCIGNRPVGRLAGYSAGWLGDINKFLVVTYDVIVNIEMTFSIHIHQSMNK